jgi:hypothetical protein
VSSIQTEVHLLDGARPAAPASIARSSGADAGPDGPARTLSSLTFFWLRHAATACPRPGRRPGYPRAATYAFVASSPGSCGPFEHLHERLVGGGTLTPSAGRGELKRGMSVSFCTPQAPAAARVEPGGRRTAGFWLSSRNASARPRSTAGAEIRITGLEASGSFSTRSLWPGSRCSRA